MTPFGTTPDGQTVHAITLGAGDLTATIITWGAALQDLRLAGVGHPLTLGSDDLSDYLGDMRHHGTLIGPIANRISIARVRVEGMDYELERNQDGRIHLHSGKDATHRRRWDIVDHGSDFVTLSCKLSDGVCGLPGNRKITATYRIIAPATLTLKITGTSDATTPMNFANHSYWNLDGTDDWSGHRLNVAADRYLPGTKDFFPTGEIAPVAGTALDFREPQTIAPQAPPLDNNFCLADGPRSFDHALTLVGASGVRMSVVTDQPGIQVYDGRDARRPGRQTYEGLAIEAQGWPDAPTHRHFPSIMVGPDTPYSQNTSWTFSAD